MVAADVIESLSRDLWRAETTHSPMNTVTSICPELTIDDAYRIQETTLAIRASSQLGFKLGYTSAAMRAQMNIAEPNYGVLTKDHFLSPQQGFDGYVLTEELIHPLVEPEIALLIETDIFGDGHTVESVAPSIKAVIPALEIVDTRYKEYKFSLVDNISDNSSAARFIFGSPKKLSEVEDLRLSGVLLWSNDDCLDTGVGANSMGNPLASIAWLANFLSKKNLGIPAGSIVMTGGLTKAHPAHSEDTFFAEFGGIGSVKAYFS